jgi:hypothetical protein
MFGLHSFLFITGQSIYYEVKILTGTVGHGFF